MPAGIFAVRLIQVRDEEVRGGLLGDVPGE